MPTPESIEEHWRTVLLERLQKVETSVDGIRSELGELKTQAAVAASEAKARGESSVRIENEVKKLADLIRDLEKKIDGQPTKKDYEALEARVKVVEEWKANLTGRLVVIGSVVSVVVGVLAAVAVKVLGG